MRKKVFQTRLNSFFLNKFIYFIYLFLAALGLRSCVRAFSSCGERGLLFVAVHGLLIAVASLVVARGLSSCGSRALECRLSSCGARDQLLCSMWDLPGPGLEPVSPALAGGFLTTAPPGKSLDLILDRKINMYVYVCVCIHTHIILFQITMDSVT